IPCSLLTFWLRLAPRFLNFALIFRLCLDYGLLLRHHCICDTSPDFFCTDGTTADVRPPTVRNMIFSPFGRVFPPVLPLLHRYFMSPASKLANDQVGF